MSNKNLRSPKDTTTDLRQDQFVRLAMIFGGSQAIENQEAAGQRDLVSSDTLPTDMQGDAREVLAAAGIQFLGVVEKDDMFQYVSLPEGWRKVSTDHSMWSNLEDEFGHVRASIFYKAPYYDRSAHISVNRRYSTRLDYTRLREEGIVVVYVKDGDETIHTTKAIKLKNSDDYDERCKAQDEVIQMAEDWLDEYYAEWENPAAYWDYDSI